MVRKICSAGLICALSIISANKAEAAWAVSFDDGLCSASRIGLDPNQADWMIAGVQFSVPGTNNGTLKFYVYNYLEDGYTLYATVPVNGTGQEQRGFHNDPYGLGMYNPEVNMAHLWDYYDIAVELCNADGEVMDSESRLFYPD